MVMRVWREVTTVWNHKQACGGLTPCRLPTNRAYKVHKLLRKAPLGFLVCMGDITLRCSGKKAT